MPTKPSPHPHSVRGFITTLVLGLMPFICSALIALWAHSQFLLSDAKALSICRNNLLEGQRVASWHLIKLLDLNPLVLALRAEKKAAASALVTAIASANPTAISFARTAMNSVQHKILLLRAQQKHHLWQAQQSVLISTQKTKSEIQKLNQFHLFQTKYFSLRAKSSPLAVRPDSPTSELPLYEPRPSFSVEQTSHVSWRFSLSATEEGWKPWFHLKTIKQNYCAASLKESASFTETLVMGKF